MHGSHGIDGPPAGFQAICKTADAVGCKAQDAIGALHRGSMLMRKWRLWRHSHSEARPWPWPCMELRLSRCQILYKRRLEVRLRRRPRGSGKKPDFLPQHARLLCANFVLGRRKICQEATNSLARTTHSGKPTMTTSVASHQASRIRFLNGKAALLPIPGVGSFT